MGFLFDGYSFNQYSVIAFADGGENQMEMQAIVKYEHLSVLKGMLADAKTLEALRKLAGVSLQELLTGMAWFKLEASSQEDERRDLGSVTLGELRQMLAE